ncbi:unnamed protein product, partial [Thlaspi arvense]
PPFPPLGKQRHHQDFSHGIHMGRASCSPTMQPPAPPLLASLPVAAMEPVVKKKRGSPTKYVPDNKIDLGRRSIINDLYDDWKVCRFVSGFSGTASGDEIPLCDANIISITFMILHLTLRLRFSNCFDTSFIFFGCLIFFRVYLKELAEAQKGQDEGLEKKCIMRQSWALVHSKIPADIQRGIAMLEDK